MSRGIASSICHTLYSSRDYLFHQVTHRAIRSGEVIFASEDEILRTTLFQKEHLEKMLYLVGKDSPTDGVRRLCEMSKYIYAEETKTRPSQSSLKVIADMHRNM